MRMFSCKRIGARAAQLKRQEHRKGTAMALSTLDLDGAAVGFRNGEGDHGIPMALLYL